MSCRTGDVTFSLVLVYIWLVLIPLAHGVGSCNYTSSMKDITVTCIFDPKTVNYTASFVIDGGYDFTNTIPTSSPPFVNPISFTYNQTVSGQKYRVLVEEVHSGNIKIFIYNATVAVVPLKPVNLKVQDRGEDFLTLFWNTSFGTVRDSHEIYYRKENETNAQMILSPSADNKYKLTNLSHGTKYVVYIVAVTLEAKSPESDKITESTAPKPPTNVTAVPNDSSKITVSWSPPDLFFQGSYLAKYTPRGEQAEVNITGCTKSSCTFTPKNVPSGQPLLISVYSLSQGIYSVAASVNSSTAPGSVSNFHGSSKEAGLVVSWTAPINSEQVSYTINATNLYSLFDSKIYSEPANNITSFTKEIMGLIGGSLYEVKIQAESTFAKGEISTSNIYTLPERVNNLSGVAINTTAYNLTWDLSSRSRIAYLNITVSPESMVQISKSTFYVITDLKPGNLYNVSIVTISDINPAFPSPLVQKDFRTKPVKPKINSVIANETSLTIGITRESSEGDWDYIMTHLNTLSVQVKMDEVKFDNLEPGRLYRLEAYTAIGMARSDNITVNLFTKPKPPKSLDVVVDGTRFRAKWESPDFGFDGFNVTLTKLVGTEFLIEQHQGPIKENEIGFPNLTAGATYRVTVVTVKGDQASTAISKENTTEKLDVSKAELIGGVVAGIFILIILIIIAVLLVKKIRNQPKKAVKYSAPRPHWKHSVMSQLSRPVKLVDFPTHVQKMSSDSDLKYAEEYEDLKDVGRDQPCTAAEFPPNRPKNRFTNILPYDHSRVKLLPTDDEEGSDYINANYMPGYSSKREYIATQGPLPSTRDDFWRMIWEQNCRNIVMLTRCQEKGREKSDHYWPNDAEPKFYGDLQVTILNETHMPDWTITEFKVAMGEQSRNVRHFHYLVWPDFGVPSTCTSLIRFVRTVREKLIREGGPIVTHCSAGVGRSGTFIVLDHLLQLIREKDEVDIFSLVYKLRKERVLMVQTEQQYKFIHECLLCVLEGREEDITYMNFGQVNAAFEEGQQQSIVDQDTDFGINMDHDDEGINVETV